MIHQLRHSPGGTTSTQNLSGPNHRCISLPGFRYKFFGATAGKLGSTQRSQHPTRSRRSTTEQPKRLLAHTHLQRISTNSRASTGVSSPPNTTAVTRRLILLTAASARPQTRRLILSTAASARHPIASTHLVDSRISSTLILTQCQDEFAAIWDMR
ncbi:hypothetical protein niasHT_000720 [Heterodera trifolii]|uniref:Uncharacterized protein n=1 Tax=Heterodera trifolii TaxID=157864 RepID=A0ABD2MEA9_9BILA